MLTNERSTFFLNKISFLLLHFILHFPKDNLIVYGYVNFFFKGRYFCFVRLNSLAIILNLSCIKFYFFRKIHV